MDLTIKRTLFVRVWSTTQDYFGIKVNTQSQFSNSNQWQKRKRTKEKNKDKEGRSNHTKIEGDLKNKKMNKAKDKLRKGLSLWIKT